MKLNLNKFYAPNYAPKKEKTRKHYVYGLISGERGTNQISKTCNIKGLGNAQKTIDTEFDTFNIL
jgi:hypothetical protein